MATSPKGKKPAPRKTKQTPAATTKDAGVVAPVQAKPTDWERIELDYRAGIKTLRQIADENGVSHPAITKRAKRDGWSRDLGAKIQAKADELVTKELVTSLVTTETKIAERQLIEVNAQAVADVRLAHRRDIHRARRLTNSLLSELEKQTAQVPELQELGEILRRPDDKGMDKLNDLYQAIISLPERSKTMKVLAESLQKLVDMERTAFGMDKEAEKKSDALESLLGRIASGNGNGFAPVADDPERQPSSSIPVSSLDED